MGRSVLSRTCLVAALLCATFAATGCTTTLAGAEKAEVREFSIEGTGRELGRGVTNVALCWLEIPREVEARLAEEPIAGPTGGLLAVARGSIGLVSGALAGTGRLVVGVCEILLSPFPPYDPLLDPAYPPYVADCAEAAAEEQEEG